MAESVACGNEARRLTEAAQLPLDGDTVEEQFVRQGLARARLVAILNALSVAGGLLVLVVIFSVASPYFLTTGNIYRVFQQAAIVAVLAIGQSFVIYTAGIDLSQGALMGLCAVVGGTVMVDQHSIALGILTAIGVGLAAGGINGLLITRARLVPFIATLAMLGVASGASLLFTNGQPVFNVPSSFSSFGSSGMWVFPYIVVVAAGLAGLAQLYLVESRGGRYVYAVGSNPAGAALAGISTRLVTFGVYAVAGVLVGIAAMLQLAYVNSGQPTTHTNLLLESIAAVVIGGGSLFGGEGMLWGSMVGVLLITVLYNGTELLGISTYLQTILLGGVVIMAVTLDNLRRRERTAA